jgi:hypothetical protein
VRISPPTDRIEFQAFPKVEGIMWSCKQIRVSRLVGTRLGQTKYRFKLNSRPQATAFVEETQSACENSEAPIARPNARKAR